MRWTLHYVALIFVFAFCSAMASATTPGSFRGTIVETDEAPLDSGWIYVKGRDGGIRKVDISRARISYDDSSAGSRQSSPARKDLVAGTEVRVTAEQGSDGEWRATLVEIVANVKERKPGEKTGSGSS